MILVVAGRHRKKKVCAVSQSQSSHGCVESSRVSIGVGKNLKSLFSEQVRKALTQPFVEITVIRVHTVPEP